MPVSKDTLLRLVRARAPEANPASRSIGIDDWAWKRGPCYGTVVCDLERREIVDRSPTAKPPPSKRGWRIIPPRSSS
jgi:hypothetical protein